MRCRQVEARLTAAGSGRFLVKTRPPTSARDRRKHRRQSHADGQIQQQRRSRLSCHFWRLESLCPAGAWKSADTAYQCCGCGRRCMYVRLTSVKYSNIERSQKIRYQHVMPCLRSPFLAITALLAEKTSSQKLASIEPHRHTHAWLLLG